MKAHRGKVMRKMKADSLAELVTMAQLELETVLPETALSGPAGR